MMIDTVQHTHGISIELRTFGGGEYPLQGSICVWVPYRTYGLRIVSNPYAVGIGVEGLNDRSFYKKDELDKAHEKIARLFNDEIR